MVIYYYNNYSDEECSSHALLETVIDKRLTIAGNCELTATKLIAALETGEKGKPVIPGYDAFSISHSGKTWAVLFNEYDCGLDIQYMKSADYIKLAERWFHKDEINELRTIVKEHTSSYGGCEAFEFLEAEPDAETGCNRNLASAFFRIWARREALVKAVGTSIVNTELPSTLDKNVVFEGKIWQLKDVVIPEIENLFCAVCAGNIDEVRIEKIDNE